MIRSGQFTIKSNEPSTGRAHLVAVVCDLCSGSKEFDPKQYRSYEDGIGEVIKGHRCQKPKKGAKPIEMKEPEDSPFGMVQAGKTVRERLGRR